MNDEHEMTCECVFSPQRSARRSASMEIRLRLHASRQIARDASVHGRAVKTRLTCAAPRPTGSAMSDEISDNKPHHRYEMNVDGVLAYVAYSRAPGTIT